MSLATEWVRYGPGNEYLAFEAWPDRALLPLPAIVVIQEVWGVDGHIEDIACRFAKAGYVAFAPDLYSRSGERPQALRRERVTEVLGLLNSLPPASTSAVLRDPEAREAELSRHPDPERARLGESMAALFSGLGPGGMKLEGFLPPLLASMPFLRRDHPRTLGQKVAAVGFCMGGGLAALLACRDPELALAAVFYGSAPPESSIEGIRCPLAGFYGGLDKRITDAVPAFAAAMRKAGKPFEVHVYEGAPHAFFNDTRPSYNVAAARDSYARLLEMLRETLP